MTFYILPTWLCSRAVPSPAKFLLPQEPMKRNSKLRVLFNNSVGMKDQGWSESFKMHKKI